MTRDISNGDDIIDSRDIIDRIEELEGILSDAWGANTEGHNLDFEEWVEAVRADASPAHQHAHWDEVIELLTLRGLADEASGYASDWEYGVTLIRDSYFQDYAEELAEDIGAINRAATWPNNCIDWARAADQLQVDYTSVDFGGVTYWVR